VAHTIRENNPQQNVVRLTRTSTALLYYDSFLR
jgi:hypothetical protein